MWRMFRDPNYDPIDRCSCPDLEKASTNADRYMSVLLKLYKTLVRPHLDIVSA